MWVQVANGGGFEALAIDYAGRLINKEYAERVSSHEAGHFLVAYLIGLLPKKYIISSVDAFKRSPPPPSTSPITKSLTLHCRWLCRRTEH